MKTRIFSVLLIVFAANTFAQEIRIGDEIAVKIIATLKDDRGKEVRKCVPGMSFKVVDIKEDRIRIDEENDLWIGKNSIMPLDQSLEYFSKQIKLAPKEPTWHYARASIYTRLEKFDKVIVDYSAIIKLRPDWIPAYFMRGLAWASHGDQEKAILDFDTVLRKERRNWDCMRHRGIARLQLGKVDEAIEDFDLAIQINPDNWNCYAARGDAHNKNGKYRYAISDYSTAIKLNPRNYQSISNRGLAYYRVGDIGNALNDFDDSPSLEQNQPEALCNMAWIMSTCPEEKYRNSKRAIQCALKACETTDWKRPGFLDTLAAAYAQDGKFKKAVKTINLAIGLAPNSKKAAYQNRLELYKNNIPYRENQ